MSADQIKSTPCIHPGTISTWDTLKEVGESLRTVEDFPSC